MARSVAIVDPYEAGALYAPLLSAHGCACHRVRTHPDLTGRERRATLRPRDFDSTVDLADGLEAAVAALAARRVSMVLAGHEHGVEAADALATALGLPCNRVEATGLGLPRNSRELSAARRDKALMAERAATAGLAVPAQCCASEAETLLSWARARGRWPVVAKPPRGSGSQGVERCTSEGELEAALARIFAAPDAFGQANHRALVQEALDGEEYAVDTVSWGGRHALSAVWRYRRPAIPAGPVELFDAKEILPPQAAPAERLFAYVRRLLDALGIQYGPAHSEVMLAGGQPVLIEVGARAHGGAPAHELARLATGDSQVDQVVRAVVHRGLDGGAGPRPLHGRALLLVLKNREPGHRLDARTAQQIEALPTVRKVLWNASAGAAAPTVAGLVFLVDVSGHAVAGAEAAIRELERSALYSPAGESL